MIVFFPPLKDYYLQKKPLILLLCQKNNYICMNIEIVKDLPNGKFDI